MREEISGIRKTELTLVLLGVHSSSVCNVKSSVSGSYGELINEISKLNFPSVL